MDELTALEQMRTRLAREESPEQLAFRTGWRPGNSGRSGKTRLARFTPLVAGLATTAAVAVTVTLVAELPKGHAPAPPAGSGGPRPNQALLDAAENAEKQREPVGKYWHSRRIDGLVYAIGQSRKSHYKVELKELLEDWTERTGKQRSFTAGQTLGALPVSDRDTRAWKKAGAPVVFKEVPGGDKLRTLRAVKGEYQMDRATKGMTFFGDLAPDELGELPVDARELEEYLLDIQGVSPRRGPDKFPPDPAWEVNERTVQLTLQAEQVLAETPAPPKVRAAALRMMAAQPGVEVAGTATDPLGREGTVVNLPRSKSQNDRFSSYQDQWIIDPERGTLLAAQEVVVKPPEGKARIDGLTYNAEYEPDRFHEPGEVSSYQAYEVAEWTGAMPEWKYVPPTSEERVTPLPDDEE